MPGPCGLFVVWFDIFTAVCIFPYPGCIYRYGPCLDLVVCLLFGLIFSLLCAFSLTQAAFIDMVHAWTLGGEVCRAVLAPDEPAGQRVIPVGPLWTW